MPTLNAISDEATGCFGLYFSLFPPYREVGGGAQATYE